jgi:dephospho-CoA kinase
LVNKPSQGQGQGQDPNRALRVGLTGGIGSGKSTVARMLVDRGALLVDTDAIARSLTAPGGAALAAIAEAFGPEMVGADGAMDRDRMRALVFADPHAKQRLEAIIHPLIGREADRQAAAAAPGQPVVFDVPLLAESGRWRDRVDRVLVVDCDEATQVSRVMARNGWPAETVQRVMAQQASRAQRRAVADAVILNDGLSLEDLRRQVEALWSQWLGAMDGA